jgi:hypothetical protein
MVKRQKLTDFKYHNWKSLNNFKKGDHSTSTRTKMKTIPVFVLTQLIETRSEPTEAATLLK